MNIILIGPPGAGKGTQSKLLEENFDLKQLSTGDMLRAAKTSGSKMGKMVAQVMQRGDLVTDDIVIGLISEQIELETQVLGFIFDGFPRTLAQADALAELLKEKQKSDTIVIQMKVDDEVLVRRITGRFNCSECGEVYHKESNLPKNDKICNKCSAENCFIQRADDNESSFRTRLLAFYRDTAPLIGYYYAKGTLNSIDGLLDIQSMHEQIRLILDTETILNLTSR